MTKNKSSIGKTIDILRSLGNKPYEKTAIEISNELDINRTTVHRILGILMEEDMVLQNPMNKKYYLGPEAYHIGIAFISRNNTLEQIKYILEKVAEDTKQSVGYSMLIEDKVMNIFEIESYQPIKIGYRPGSYYPIHCGAYGKCIMAYYKPLDKLKEIVYSTNLDKRTYNTITDPERLLKEYEDIRKKGYAISDEENMLGAIGIGVPVLDSKDNIIGSVAAAGIKGNLCSEDIENIKEKLLKSAAEISKLIG